MVATLGEAVDSHDRGGGPGPVENGISQRHDAGAIRAHDLQDQQIHSHLSREQGQISRENDAHGRCRVSDVDRLFGAGPDQLCTGDGGKSKA